MTNISLTIKVDTSIQLGITEDIILSVVRSPEEVLAYKDIFQEYQDIFG